ncbi:MAG: hypothetical protein ACR2JC_09820 [Chloroflexota bacterium]
MRIQRNALRERISELQRIDEVLGELLDHRRAGGRWDWELVTRVSAAVQQGLVQKGDKQMQEYDSPEEMQREFAELGKQVPPEEIADIERGWTTLLRDVHANLELDPASREARALAERWDVLQQATMAGFRGNEKLAATVAEGYRRGRYAAIEGTPRPEDFAFIKTVHEARNDEGEGRTRIE